MGRNPKTANDFYREITMTKYLSIAILLTGFLVGNACGEEFTLKKFFKISPDDVNFDDPNYLISGDFKR